MPSIIVSKKGEPVLSKSSKEDSVSAKSDKSECHDESIH